MNGPRVFEGEAMILMGRQERYAMSDAHQHIPAQWAWFGPRLLEINERLGDDTFGLCADSTDDAMTYLCGVRVAAAQETPDLVCIDVPALRYAAFAHAGPVANLSQTIVEALGEALPAAGLSVHRAPGVPDLVEHYGSDFNPQTGLGTIEIWVPVGPGADPAL